MNITEISPLARAKQDRDNIGKVDYLSRRQKKEPVGRTALHLKGESN